MEARPTRRRRGRKEWRSATRPPSVVVGIRGRVSNRVEREIKLGLVDHFTRWAPNPRRRGDMAPRRLKQPIKPPRGRGVKCTV
jgi:hypothetical protein